MLRLKKSQQALLRKILRQNKTCVLATASLSGKPEAATMLYAIDSKSNLYFETFYAYRKYPNLKSNPRTSIVITDLPYSVQMDGKVVELKSSKAEEAKKRLIARHSPGGKDTKAWYENTKMRFFKFTPKWVRIVD